MTSWASNRGGSEEQEKQHLKGIRFCRGQKERGISAVQSLLLVQDLSRVGSATKAGETWTLGFLSLHLSFVTF